MWEVIKFNACYVLFYGSLCVCSQLIYCLIPNYDVLLPPSGQTWCSNDDKHVKLPSTQWVLSLSDKLHSENSMHTGYIRSTVAAQWLTNIYFIRAALTSEQSVSDRSNWPTLTWVQFLCSVFLSHWPRWAALMKCSVPRLSELYVCGLRWASICLHSGDNKSDLCCADRWRLRWNMRLLALTLLHWPLLSFLSSAPSESRNGFT